MSDQCEKTGVGGLRQACIMMIALCLPNLVACRPRPKNQDVMIGRQTAATISSDTLSSLYQHDGKVVSFRARNSDDMEQHPIFQHARTDPRTGEIIHLSETYVDLVDDEAHIQIVITWDRPITCPGLIRVTGEVEVVDLGGPEGTKSSYSRPWVRVHHFECERQ